MKKEILNTKCSERSVRELSVVIENRSDLGLVVSSRVIAEQLDKRHSNVIRDLEAIVSENSNLSSLIISSSYEVEGQNRSYKEYLLTKDGFTLYMFNIQGYNDFKLAYINKFNEMEKELSNNFNIPQTYAQALKLAYEQQLLIEEQEQKIKVLEPKGEYFDALVDRNLLTNFRDTAKEFGIKQNDFVKFLIDKKYIFRDKKNKLKPYSHYMDLFELKEWKTDDKSGVQTLITPRGRETFRLLISR